MRSVEAVLIAAVFAVQVGSAQGGPSFEVASIKPIAPGSFDLQHLAIKIDPQLAVFGNRSLLDLVAYAFHVNTFQVIGPKGLWATFTIQAKLPDGATTNQVPDMLVQLLVERFQMKFHKEDKEFSGYDLIVDAKGPKISLVPPDSKPTDHPGQLATTVDRFAELIAFRLKKPVFNETGLQGEYLFPRLTLLAEEGAVMMQASALLATNPGAAKALVNEAQVADAQASLSQAGLKVVSRKRQLPAIIIDRIETSPTD
jgi:uncharacterized protein (TIGR03435 family)